MSGEDERRTLSRAEYRADPAAAVRLSHSGPVDVVDEQGTVRFTLLSGADLTDVERRARRGEPLVYAEDVLPLIDEVRRLRAALDERTRERDAAEASLGEKREALRWYEAETDRLRAEVERLGVELFNAEAYANNMRDGYIEDLAEAEAEVERLRAVAEAARAYTRAAYTKAVDRYAGYEPAERRGLRMVLEAALDALAQPNDQR